eukprot:421502-Prymnesium_polylepis.1
MGSIGGMPRGSGRPGRDLRACCTPDRLWHTRSSRRPWRLPNMPSHCTDQDRGRTLRGSFGEAHKWPNRMIHDTRFR